MISYKSLESIRMELYVRHEHERGVRKELVKQLEKLIAVVENEIELQNEANNNSRLSVGER